MPSSKSDRANAQLSSSASDPTHLKARQQKEAILYTGFVAQEVDAAAKALGYDFSGVDAPKSDNDYYGLRYAQFVVPLVQAVQEQQKMIETQQHTMETQQREIDELKAMVNSLKEAKK